MAKGSSSSPAPTYNDIKVTSKELPGSRVELTVDIPVAVVAASYDATMKYIRKNIKMEGFRPGKGKPAPDTVLIQHMGGKKEIYRFAVEEMLNKTVPIALQPWAKRALQDSEQILTTVEELVEKFDVANPIQYKISVDIAPEVKFSQDPKTISVTVEAAGDEALAKKEAEAKLLSFRKSKGSLRVVADRGATPTDVLIMDFDCTRNDKNEPIPGARRRGWQLDLSKGEEFVPGLTEGLVGIKAGEERNVVVTFPATWEPEYLRGVEATCAVKVKEVFDWRLPEEDAALAQMLDPRCKTMADLRATLLKNELEEIQRATDVKVQSALADQLAAVADVAVPRSMLEEVARNEYQAQLADLMSKGIMGLDQVQKLLTPQMLSNFMKAQQTRLEAQARAALAVDFLAEREGIKVPEDEIEEEVKSAKLEFLARGEEFDEARIREQTADMLRGAKVLQWLEKNAKVTVTPYKGA
jgi:trigger factor